VRAPSRGELWRVELEPVRGHEQGGARPCLIVSNDIFNRSAAELLAVVPLTTKGRAIRSFVRIEPPEGGLRQVSYIICDQIRTVSRRRAIRVFGAVSNSVMQEVEERLRVLLDL
jgi:mRNA interferase MazF